MGVAAAVGVSDGNDVGEAMGVQIGSVKPEMGVVVGGMTGVGVPAPANCRQVGS